LTAGTTVLASIHSLASVRAQAASEPEFSGRWRRHGLMYAVAGGGSLIVVGLALQHLAPRIFPHFPSLNTPQILSLSAVMPTLAVYYSVSVIPMRHARTDVLALTSCCTVGIYYAFVASLASGGLSELILVFGSVLLFLPLLVVLLLQLLRVSERYLGWRVAGLAALGYLPLMPLSGLLLLEQ
jgi:hypothetical protein